MKKTLLLSAALLCAVSCASQQEFTVTGHIPGLKAGLPVKIVSKEQGGKRKLASAKTIDGGFLLTGSVDSPSLCEIRIDSIGPKKDIGAAISLFVENCPIEVSAEHVDSLPPSFYVGTHGLLLEHKLKIKGGKAQREYAEYCEAMFPSMLDAARAHYEYFWADEGKNRKRRAPEEEKALEKAYNDAYEAREAASRRFIEEHPAYLISANLWMDELNPFQYSSEELDALADKFKDVRDPKRAEALRQKIANCRAFTRDCDYTDFAVNDIDKKERRVSEFAADGSYMMIDFWASWCGPCRASIPHVRDLHNEYGDKLRILSVSVDEDESAWRQAMDAEKMEWTQLWAPGEKMEALAKAYQLKAIPYMILVSPKGKILYAGSSPDEISDRLARELK